MDYFQGVVADYLSADRAMFVNPECRIELHPGTLKRGEHWYCDILAVNFREATVYLCEVTLSQTVAALLKRLREWNANWPAVRAAVARDNSVPASWTMRPWVFVPEAQGELVSRKVAEFLDPSSDSGAMPEPLITSLESVTPWQYTAPRLPGEVVGADD
jgi:hypothetical protein